MIEPIGNRFKTSDGQTWPTMTDAEVHENLWQLEQAYNKARREFGEALAATQRTADGEPFNFDALIDYYFITPGWADRPQLQTIAFRGWGWSWGENPGEFKIRARDERDRELEFWIGDLFLKRENAERALVTAIEYWLEEQQSYLDAKRRALPKQ